MKRASLNDIFRPLNDIEKLLAPEELFYSGDTSLLRTSRRVAILTAGTASKDGRSASHDLSRWLLGEDVIIVSGLAGGVETADHKALIEAAGRAIAVLSPPRMNRDLRRPGERDVLVLSTLPPGREVTREHVAICHRLIAVLSDAVVVVEAEDGSESLHVAWEGLRLNRPVWIADRAVNNAALAWPKELLRYGASVLTDDRRNQFLDELPDREIQPHVGDVPF